jgi:hypothetical protein
MNHHIDGPAQGTTDRAGRSRLSASGITVLLFGGWVALLWATDLSLLAAIQTGMIGLGAIGTAIVVALWRQT